MDRPALSRRKRKLVAGAGAVVLSAVLLVCLEWGFQRLNALSAPADAAGIPHEMFQPDALMGYVIKPNMEVRHTKRREHELLYEAVYTTDAWGRRASVCPEPADRPRFAVFFGCSYTFGEGVDDAQTLPSAFANLAPDYAPYNYGVPGYGTQHMLALMESANLNEQIPQQQGVGVYVFIGHHAQRTIPSMRVYTTWGREFPYYEIQDGALVRLAALHDARPWTTQFYDLAAKSAALQYGKIDMPRSVNDQHIALLVRIILESKSRFEELFPGSDFVVITYPGAAQKLAHRLVSALSEAGVQAVNLQHLFDDAQHVAFIDRHPTGASNVLVAAALANALGVKTAAPTRTEVEVNHE
jgi:hypothetical protein